MEFRKLTEQEIYDLQHPSDEVRMQWAIEARNETPKSVLYEINNNLFRPETGV